MDGKRFGLGVLGGLLLAAAIIASASANVPGLGSAVMSPAFSTGAGQGVTTSSTSITTTSSASNAATATYSTSTTVTSQSTSTTTNNTAAVAALPTSAQSAASSAQHSVPIDAFYSSAVSANSDMKTFAGLSGVRANPVILTIVVLVPVAVAAALGLVLYRTSARRIAKD